MWTADALKGVAIGLVIFLIVALLASATYWLL
jgi:hypothetical protein